jgi:hypothetical protein
MRVSGSGMYSELLAASEFRSEKETRAETNGLPRPGNSTRTLRSCIKQMM